MNAIALPSTRCGTRLGKLASIAAPVAVGALAASAAYAGADTTFAPALPSSLISWKARAARSSPY
jgi:conjugal transfer pilus assembly protein TraA